MGMARGPTESIFQSCFIRVIRDGGIVFVLAVCQSVAEKLHGDDIVEEIFFGRIVFGVYWDLANCVAVVDSSI
jgi:hypothetical protein